MSLPRVVGIDDDGVEITAQNGRYGPYLKKGSDSRSLESEEAIFDITLDEAKAIYAQPKQRGRAAAKPPLRELGPDPVSGRPLIIKDGRFGAYVTDGETNATLRRGDDIASITSERAAELLAEKRAKGPAPKKKAAARKTSSAAKKATANGSGTTRRSPRRRKPPSGSAERARDAEVRVCRSLSEKRTLRAGRLVRRWEDSAMAKGKKRKRGKSPAAVPPPTPAKQQGRPGQPPTRPAVLRPALQRSGAAVDQSRSWSAQPCRPRRPQRRVPDRRHAAGRT